MMPRANYSLAVSIVLAACACLAAAWPKTVLPYSDRVKLSISYTNYGKHLFALGKDGQLWHVYQLGEKEWTEWAPLTDLCPNATDAKRKCNFNADPVVGKNLDGRLEVFVRFADNLDVWQLYQKDANDPMSWTSIRESACVDQDQKSGKWYCFGDGGDADNEAYWLGQPAFPTSDLTLVNDPKSGALTLIYRGFTGNMFSTTQRIPGNSSLYSTLVPVGNRIME